MAEKFKGRFHPKNPQKYLGDVTKIIYRSSWEARVMMDLDHDPKVIGWSSEEVRIPYISPIDGRYHTYYPDFLVQKRKGDIIETTIIEVKPFNQVREPIKGTKTKRRFFNEVKTYGTNSSKWKYAEDFCKRRGWKFKILTEKELKVL